MNKSFFIIAAALMLFSFSAAAKKIETYQSGHVNASADEVWALIADIDNWEEWNSAVAFAELTEGDGLTVGSRGRFLPVIGGKKPPFKIKGKVVKSAKPNVLEYSANLMGMNIIFGFEVKEEEDGCEVTSYETIDGPASWIFMMLFGQDGLDEEHRTWVEEIKKKLELN